LNKVAFAAVLLAGGVKVDIVDEDGATALNFALQHEDPAIVEILIEGG
jgi:ankyrin repeat protein